jgi:hypothetical protein
VIEPIFSGIAVREAFHLVLLRFLVRRRGTEGWALKGGLNLRLFFGSVRYSEDMDLDADPRLNRTLKRDILGILRDPIFRRRLMAFGVRGMEPDTPRLAKDTETTGRVKLSLIVGGVPYQTKVEISFRPRAGRDVVELASPSRPLALRYLKEGAEYPFQVPHYPRTPAVRQKFSALAGRPAVQARDVFDLMVLTANGHRAEINTEVLRAQLSNKTLIEARDRALTLPESEFRGKVLEFLDEADMEKWRDRWDEIRLSVAALAEELIAMPGGPAEEVTEPSRASDEEDQDDE